MNRYGKRCVLYPRVSTEMQVDGYSLEGQKNMLTRFADREEMIIVDTYEDAGKSGKSIEGRPAFQKMLRDIEDGLDIDYILVYKLSRFGRNAADILNSLELVQSYGVNLICIEEGIDSSQTSGKLLISVLSAVAEIERENIIEQTMNGRREKARQGGWNGGFAPYGYTLEDNKLMIEETEAVAIRKIFELYTSSEIGLGGIANQLNLQGIRKIPRQNGTLEDWTGHFIKLILDNPVYCGKIAYGRRTKEKVKGTKNDYQMKRNDDYILTEGQHKGIVSEEVWEKAHAKRLRTGVKQPSKIGRDRVHLLSGLLKCPVCGSPMYTNKHAWTNKDGTYKEIYYYVCSRNRMVRGKHCEYKAMLKKTDIEPMVIEAIREIVRNEEYAQAIKKRIGVQIDTKAVDKELEGYQAKLKEVDLNKTRLEREIDSLPADAKYRERKLHDMTLRLDSLYDVIVELEEKIEDARLRRDAIKQQAITLENIYKIMVNFDCVYNIINDEEKRNVVTALIKEIEIYRNDESEYPLKRIGLNFPVFKDGGEVTELLWDKGNTVDSRAVYRDRYQFGDKIGKTMYLRGIAPEMKNGLFSMLSELPFDHVITMHIDAMDQAEAVQEIEKKLAYMHKEEYEAIAKARERNMPASIAVSYDLKSKMHHTEQMMDDITTKNQKIFKVCILIHTYGDSNAQLDERVRRICSTVQQQTCRFDSILYEQRNAMNSMLPLGKKWLGLERTLETVSTAIYVPFTTQELFQPGGLYEGINARSKNLILCNRKLLPAPAGMVLGMTGYGKSFSVMQMVTNIMLRWPDDDIVLIDPEQEYTHLVTAMGGVVIDISASSPSHINPMDITEDYGDDEDPIRLKSQFLQNFCQLILHSSELSPQERTFIDVAAGLTYQRYMANPKREEMPTLHDFYRNLALQGEEVKPLLTALKLYVSGSMDLFAHQTNVNVQNHCICFNTVKLGKSMQSIGMLTVLDQVWNRITRNRVLGRRTWVFTDEFQQLLGNKDCTDFYFQLSSRARKWGAILTSITQHVRSVLDNEDARRMLSDCGYIKLLNQSPDDANDLARLLHISNEEKRYIENAEVGSGLLIVSKTVVPFNNDFPKDTELFRLMDTSPNRKS